MEQNNHFKHLTYKVGLEGESVLTVVKFRLSSYSARQETFVVRSKTLRSFQREVEKLNTDLWLHEEEQCDQYLLCCLKSLPQVVDI